MIKTKRDYDNAIRAMIRRVQRAKDKDEFNTFKMSAEEAEILLDCITAGYLIGEIQEPYRTMDGKAHPELTNTFVTPKGLAMLEPSKTELKSNLGKYLMLSATEDIYITKNGRVVAKLSNPFQDRVETAKSLFGIISDDMTLERAREERRSQI